MGTHKKIQTHWDHESLNPVEPPLLVERALPPLPVQPICSLPERNCNRLP